MRLKSFLEHANVGRAMAALAGIGYRPAVPVSADEFADPEIRRRWIEERMKEAAGRPQDAIDIEHLRVRQADDEPL